jgi:molybdopterin synthase sulfur carrier subunit
MRVRVLYFAAVRDLLGRDEEWLELPPQVRTVRDFGDLLAQRYPGLVAHLPALRFARNETFAEPGEDLVSDDVVAIIPPVAGG